jgi:hypothetical protein
LSGKQFKGKRVQRPNVSASEVRSPDSIDDEIAIPEFVVMKSRVTVATGAVDTRGNPIRVSLYSFLRDR